MRSTTSDLAVELYVQRIGVLHGDWPAFDSSVAVNVEVPLQGAYGGLVDDIGGFIERLRQG
ncbi:hypothetical protein [Boudabousia marimammalium]|uniref:hypothetical protein n=1 Tax=Boudabousia marimammalium TaxID=156892 RepID=UPI000AB28FC3|nr:hypothetical protein [Boudabousia marimammalium]